MTSIPAAIMAFVAAASAGICLAQPPRMSVPQPGSSDSGLPVRKIGPGDLLGIFVYDAPELSRPTRVDEKGNIRLSMIEQPIKAVGVYPSDLEQTISAELKNGKVLVDPIVSVTVVEYQSHPINVSGAVKTPLTFQATGQVTLLDALARASGVTDNAGPDVLISRRQKAEGTQSMLTQRIPLRALFAGDYPDITLEGGENIRVPEAEKIYVVGNVRRPGAFAVRDGTKPSVMKLLALSEGLNHFAQKRAYIYRGDAGTEGREEVAVELNLIMQRKSPDVALLPNDVLYIPEDVNRHSWAIALDKLLTVGLSGLGPALLYTSTR